MSFHAEIPVLSKIVQCVVFQKNKMLEVSILVLKLAALQLLGPTAILFA
jgi:hypothetical protein